MNIHTVIALGAGVLLLTACATVPPTVPASEPHGVVLAQYHYAPDDTHPVYITRINGVNVQSPLSAHEARARGEDRMMYRLPPGTHTITMVADLSQTRQPYARYQRSPWEYQRSIEIEVEEGKVYTLAARHDGPTLRDWTPVVVSVRDLR